MLISKEIFQKNKQNKTNKKTKVRKQKRTVITPLKPSIAELLSPLTAYSHAFERSSTEFLHSYFMYVYMLLGKRE